MKILITVISLFLTFGTIATANTSVWGTGTAYEFCSESTFHFCKSRLTSYAEREATRQMEFSCSGRGGRITMPSCRTFCNPNWMYPGDPDQMVSCRADCSATCQTN